MAITLGFSYLFLCVCVQYRLTEKRRSNCGAKVGGNVRGSLQRCKCGQESHEKAGHQLGMDVAVSQRLVMVPLAGVELL